MRDCLLFDFYPSSTRLEAEVLRVISKYDLFSADDLHVLEAEIDACGRDRRVLGVLLKSLERKGYIRKAGYICSRRGVCHGRPIVQWLNLHAWVEGKE